MAIGIRIPDGAVKFHIANLYMPLGSKRLFLCPMDVLYCHLFPVWQWLNARLRVDACLCVRVYRCACACTAERVRVRACMRVPALALACVWCGV